MIGKISIGKSFRGCLNYCLENKQRAAGTAELKKRAMILNYNLCFGGKKALIDQFTEVRKLNPNLSKPVLHVTLSFAPGEKLRHANLTDIVDQCARKMGFEKNQFVAIEHDDTRHQHIHIVANRVGLDRKTVKDNQNFRRIAEFCREMELEYSLEKVLSPKRFLSKEARQIPRIDLRKEQLRRQIEFCVSVSRNYFEFEQLMAAKNYSILKARGIAFVDKEKVRVKGSEVGYSLKRIEQLLSLSSSMRKDIINHKKQKLLELQSEHLNQRKQRELTEQRIKGLGSHPLENRNLNSSSQVLESLLKPEQQNEALEQNLIQKKKRRQSRG